MTHILDGALIRVAAAARPIAGEQAEPPPPKAAMAPAALPNPACDDELELAAVLESFGVTDAVAATFGAADVFALARAAVVEPRVFTQTTSVTSYRMARDVLVRLKHVEPSMPATAPSPNESPPSMWVHLLRGPLTLWLMAVSFPALAATEAALAQLGASTTATFAGLLSAMVMVGALTQGMAWRLPIALSQQSARAVRTLASFGLLTGLGVASVVVVVMLLVSLALRLAPVDVLALTVTFVGLSTVMMPVSLLALLDRATRAAVGLTVAGLAAVAYERFVSPWSGPLDAIALGYGVALLLSYLTLLRALRSPTSTSVTGSGDHHLPPPGQLAYKALPYLLFGGLSVLYIFLGQVAAYVGALPPGWTAERAVAALSAANLVALSAFVLTHGATEYALRRFWPVMAKARRFSLDDRAAIQRFVGRFIGEQLALLVAVQLMSVVVTVAVGPMVWAALGGVERFGALEQPIFALKLIGYSVLAIGFFGCSFLLTLTQVWAAVRAMAIAAIALVVTSVGVGVVFGVAVAPVGSIVGAATLVAVAGYELWRNITRIDYVLYQAF
ncbi:MAG: hypothetical protein NZ518_00645 [Dehalococcoidia bacterium]|nr:hypothetical protein [Dehalococcoidia bacterium]